MIRSSLKLVRVTYVRVLDGTKIHYLKEKCYASEFDGYIKTEIITKKTYEKAVSEGKRTEEVDIDNARLNIRNTLRKVS